MLKVLIERLHQGHRTLRFPGEPAVLPARFRGRPLLEVARCTAGCHACSEACPTGAVTPDPLRLDLGACLFCGRCADVCAAGAIRFTQDHRLGVGSRGDLLITAGAAARHATALDGSRLRCLGRSLKLRQVSAGGCGACEAELVALGNVVFDLGRFGIQFVASPRHADGIVVTGPVTTNMQYALHETLAAVPTPRLVIAFGACALSGGPFAGASACGAGVPADLPVDLFVPGCPPHPLTALDALLRLLGRLPETPDGKSQPPLPGH